MYKSLKGRAQQPRNHSQFQKGQATVEYAIAAVFVCLILFVGNPSPLELMLSAIRASHSASSYAIGSPTVGSAIKK